MLCVATAVELGGQRYKIQRMPLLRRVSGENTKGLVCMGDGATVRMTRREPHKAHMDSEREKMSVFRCPMTEKPPMWLSTGTMLYPFVIDSRTAERQNEESKHIWLRLSAPTLTATYLSSFLLNVLVLRINFLYLCFFIFNLLCRFTLMAYNFLLLKPQLFP